MLSCKYETRFALGPLYRVYGSQPWLASFLFYIAYHAKNPLLDPSPREDFYLTSQEGFEPPTVRLEGECSIQLSY